VRSLEELTRTFPDEWFENIEPQLLQLHDNDRVGDALALIAPWAVKLRWITFGEVDDEPLKQLLADRTVSQSRDSRLPGEIK